MVHHSMAPKAAQQGKGSQAQGLAVWSLKALGVVPSTASLDVRLAVPSMLPSHTQLGSVKTQRLGLARGRLGHGNSQQ